MNNCRLLLFDLDGTLLRSDKTISQRTFRALEGCRQRGILLGVSTSRGERNAAAFTEKLCPDILISSGGASVKYKGEYIYKAEFSREETRQIIETVRRVCGRECEITADTVTSHYWNYKTDPAMQDKSWGDSIYTDFDNFDEPSLKICAEIFDNSLADMLRNILNWCDCVRFSDGYWYKLTQKGVTKKRAVLEACAVLGIGTEEITAFGDDYADIGMLELCGCGIAMGNSIDEVRERADMVIGCNDEDGIAEYLDKVYNNT